MSRHLERKQAERRAKTFANPPSTVTLPGNVKLLAYHFRITAVDRHGRPHAFEVTRDKELPADAKQPYDATLWAAPEFMDDRIDPKLKERMDARGEAQTDLQQLMAYVDEAKRAAGTERVTGEPLPEFIARLVQEVRELRKPPVLLTSPENNAALKERLANEHRAPDVVLVDDFEAGCCPRNMYGDEGHDLTCSLARDRDYPAVPTPGIRVSDVVKNEQPTCGYEPCDGGPCERPELHAKWDRGERDDGDD